MVDVRELAVREAKVRCMYTNIRSILNNNKLDEIQVLMHEQNNYRGVRNHGELVE